MAGHTKKLPHLEGNQGGVASYECDFGPLMRGHVKKLENRGTLARISLTFFVSKLLSDLRDRRRSHLLDEIK